MPLSVARRIAPGAPCGWRACGRVLRAAARVWCGGRRAAVCYAGGVLQGWLDDVSGVRLLARRLGGWGCTVAQHGGKSGRHAALTKGGAGARALAQAWMCCVQCTARVLTPR
jgi:hypothetical protein